MKIFFSIFLAILTSKFFVDAVICKPSKISCRSKDSYTFCVDLGDTTLFLEFIHFQCREGKVCSEDTYFPCVLESEVPPTTTTFIPPSITNTPDPVTTSPGSTTPPAVTTPATPQITLTSSLLPITSKSTTERLSTTEIVTTSNTLASSSTSDAPFPTTLPITAYTTNTPSSTISLSTTEALQVSTISSSSSLNTEFFETSSLTSSISTDSPLTTLLIASSLSSVITTTEKPNLSTEFSTNTVTIIQPTTSKTIAPTSDTPTMVTTPSLQTTANTKLPTISKETTTQQITTSTTHVPTTKVPTPPACPNPQPGIKPQCKKVGQMYPGPICTKYYECVPLWLGYDAKENVCGKGKAFSASQGKCIIPPDGCVCAN